MVGHVALVTHELLVGRLAAPAAVAGAHAAQLAGVVLAVLAGRAALACADSGGSAATGPAGTRAGTGTLHSRLMGFSTTGGPSPGRSILKTSSTKTMRQSFRESSLQEDAEPQRAARPGPLLSVGPGPQPGPGLLLHPSILRGSLSHPGRKGRGILLPQPSLARAYRLPPQPLAPRGVCSPLPGCASMPPAPPRSGRRPQTSGRT